MDVSTRLDSIIAKRNLLEHPFYQAWNAGTLPLDDLRLYAAEYGAFIAGIGQGWETVGESEHAAEEAEHAELWRKFASGLGRDVVETPTTPEMQSLLATATRLFATEASALGALFAFEAQQPATAETKLTGLETHYADTVDRSACEYFDVHAGDYGEREIILRDLAMRTSEERDEAATACAEMCDALWNALSGVHSGQC